jgi:hypothetical protein
MANSLLNGKKIKVFAAAIADNINYLKNTVQHITEDEIKGKKFGMSYTFYLPSNGIATVDSSLDMTSDNKDVFEVPIVGSMVNARIPVTYNAWESLVDIEDFESEIAKPMGSVLAAQITKKVIETSVWASDGAKVVALSNGEVGIGSSDLFGLTSKLKGVRAGSQVSGYINPTILGSISSKLLSLFIPSDIQKDIYGDASIGNMGSAAWIAENYMPTISVGATAPAITAVTLSNGIATVTGTNLFNGAAFTAVNASGVAFNTVDLLSQSIPLEKYTFIVTNVNGAGTSGQFANYLRGKTVGGAAQPSATISGEENDIATATYTSLLSANSTYSVIQVRTPDALNFTPTSFNDADGCVTTKAKVDSITANYTSWTDVVKLTTLARIDVPFLACPLCSKLSRLLYVQVA